MHYLCELLVAVCWSSILFWRVGDGLKTSYATIAIEFFIVTSYKLLFIQISLVQFFIEFISRLNFEYGINSFCFLEDWYSSYVAFAAEPLVSQNWNSHTYRRLRCRTMLRQGTLINRLSWWVMSTIKYFGRTSRRVLRAPVWKGLHSWAKCPHYQLDRRA